MPQPNRATVGSDRRAARRRRLSLNFLIASSDQAEIVLAAGTYREQVVLERPVTLVAADGPGSVRIVTEHGPAMIVRAGALLRGIAVECADPRRPALLVESGAPVFEQCEFRGARVEAAGSSAPVFRHCSFRQTALAGIYARESSSARIERCAFSAVLGHALAGADSAMIEVHESQVDGARGAGLRLIGGARADVRSSTFTGCQDPGASVADTASLRMISCRIADGAAEGIRVDGSSALRGSASPRPAAASGGPDAPTPEQILSALSHGPLADLCGVIIEDCDITDSALEGVVIGEGELLLDRTRITGARRAGLLAGGAARVESRECEVAGSAASGVLVRGTARVRAAKLDVIGCGGYGLAAAEHAEVELEDCRFTDSAHTAVRLTDHAVVRATRTALRGSRSHGVNARDHAIVELTGCRIESCAREGVRIDGGADAMLRECEIARCRIGILMSTRHHPVLRGCRVREIERMGIVVGPGGMPTLTECSVTEAGTGGVFLDHGSAAQIEDCRIEETGGGGIVVCAGATPTVRRTSVAGTAESGLYFHDRAAGVFEDCRVTVRAGGPAAVHLGRDAAPVLRDLQEAAEPALELAAILGRRPAEKV